MEAGGLFFWHMHFFEAWEDRSMSRKDENTQQAQYCSRMPSHHTTDSLQARREKEKTESLLGHKEAISKPIFQTLWTNISRFTRRTSLSLPWQSSGTTEGLGNFSHIVCGLEDMETPGCWHVFFSSQTRSIVERRREISLKLKGKVLQLCV